MTTFEGATASLTSIRPAPGFLVQATKHDGLVRLLNHGSDHGSEGDPHYNRLAYSSRTGPEFTDEQLDNHISLAGKRTRIERIADGHSWWQAGESRIEVASLVHGRIEVRCVLVDGPAGVVRHGGYAVAGEHRPEAKTGDVWAQATPALGYFELLREKLKWGER